LNALEVDAEEELDVDDLGRAAEGDDDLLRRELDARGERDRVADARQLAAAAGALEVVALALQDGEDVRDPLGRARLLLERQDAREEEHATRGERDGERAPLDEDEGLGRVLVEA